MLAYGVAADAVDDYVRIAENTSIESLKKFVQVIIDVFGNEYLRTPNSADICRLLSRSRTPSTNYSINGHEYITGYYLADGIYPSWATFVKTIPCPNGPKATNFAAAQESAMKDVERAFGVLQAHFSVVRRPARFWDRQTLQHIMKACIIMHNMIIEDERDQSLPPITMHERVNAVTFLCHVTTLRNFRISFKTTYVFVTREHILNSKPIWWSTNGISKVDMKKLIPLPLAHLVVAIEPGSELSLWKVHGFLSSALPMQNSPADASPATSSPQIVLIQSQLQS
ncbi:putative nuclease HARBI1 [Cinnamomum micranthum f. kanehirae]|uniref:Putative nuclease HARBI1 n=1 Tax=Cinnamomum micranthum f. kanehirae TaxID=337451 RepID=A0A3S3NRX4_9MAGN|nr:putative nuclease HARBI1 [Cinnamomum micranthum f. kanehirae]